MNLSADALKDIRDLIGREYGEKFVPASARVYKTKVKNAQEAHEAIRPINISIMPEQLHGRIKVSRAAKISESDLIKLYALIWRRAVASQMASADMNKVQVDIVDDNNNVFRANGSTIVFEGFLKLYVEGSDSTEKEDDNILPQLHEGEETSLNKLDAVRHVTMPPPRFSEASLVRKLEERYRSSIYVRHYFTSIAGSWLCAHGKKILCSGIAWTHGNSVFNVIFR